MIRLRRLGHKSDAFYLNPDLILTVEATPDTVVTLTTQTKIIVSDSPEDVVAAVLAWRSGVLSAALPVTRRARSDVPLTLVRGASGDPHTPERPGGKR